MSAKALLLAITVAVVGAASEASATPTTVTLSSSADATLFEESGDLAAGADDGVFVGVNANTGGFAERRAALRFDLSSIPRAC